MRQMEAGIIGLGIYFLFSANNWIDFLLNPELSWKTLFGVFTFGFLMYMFFQLYWINRSVGYMIDQRAHNVVELGIEDAEKAAS